MKVGTTDEYEEMWSRFTKSLSASELADIKSEDDLAVKLTMWMSGSIPTKAQISAFTEEDGERASAIIAKNIEDSKPVEAEKPVTPSVRQIKATRKKAIMAIPYHKRVKSFSFVKPYMRSGKRIKGYWRMKHIKVNKT